MNKSQELLSVVRGITEEDGMGPLALNLGSKVIATHDGAEMPGEICGDADGKFYDADQNAYYVKMEHGEEWIPVAQLKAAEAPAAAPPAESRTAAPAKKPTGSIAERLKAAAARRGKKNEDDQMAGQGGPMTPADAQAAGAALPGDKDPMMVMQEEYECMVSDINDMRSSADMMKAEGIDDADHAELMGHMDTMQGAAQALGEFLIGKLSIPLSGASRPGTMQGPHDTARPAATV